MAEDKDDAHALDDMIEACLDKGMSVEDTAKRVAEIIDAMVDMSILGPAGAILEALDGPVILGIVRLVEATRKSPEERAARREAREKRRAERRARREERRRKKEESA